MGKRMVGIVLVLMMCAAGLATAAPAPKDLKFGVVLHTLNGSFFAKMKAGAEAAGKDLGVQVMVTAPATQLNLSEQVNMLQDYINMGVDGVATVLWDPKGFNGVIAAAHKAGIPFVAFNSDAATTARDAYVGQNLEQSGYVVGKYMFEKVMKGQGKFIMTVCAPAEYSLVLRQEGVKRAMKEYPNIQLVQTVDIGTDLTKAVGIIESAYTAHPDANAIIGVDVYAEAIGTFIHSKGLTGKVKGGGFDLVPER